MAQGTGRRAKGRNTALNSYFPLALSLEPFATSVSFLVMLKKKNSEPEMTKHHFAHLTS
jgi:hypothetical protein